MRHGGIAGEERHRHEVHGQEADGRAAQGGARAAQRVVADLEPARRAGEGEGEQAEQARHDRVAQQPVAVPGEVGEQRRAHHDHHDARGQVPVLGQEALDVLAPEGGRLRRRRLRRERREEAPARPRAPGPRSSSPHRRTNSSAETGGTFRRHQSSRTASTAGCRSRRDAYQIDSSSTASAPRGRASGSCERDAAAASPATGSSRGRSPGRSAGSGRERPASGPRARRTSRRSRRRHGRWARSGPSRGAGAARFDRSRSRSERRSRRAPPLRRGRAERDRRRAEHRRHRLAGPLVLRVQKLGDRVQGEAEPAAATLRLPGRPAHLRQEIAGANRRPEGGRLRRPAPRPLAPPPRPRRRCTGASVAARSR